MRLDFFLLLIEEGRNFSSFQKGVELFKTGFLKKNYFFTWVGHVPVQSEDNRHALSPPTMWVPEMPLRS